VHGSTFTSNITLRVSLQTIEFNCRTRLSLLVNGTFPVPIINLVAEGTAWTRLYNDENLNLTMVCSQITLERSVLILKHWHGLSQSTLPFSDGSPQASQWPIPPGHFFDHELGP
jgi:L-ascorbate oxidase